MPVNEKVAIQGGLNVPFEKRRMKARCNVIYESKYNLSVFLSSLQVVGVVG